MRAGDKYENAVKSTVPAVLFSLLTVVRMLLNSVRIINTRQVSAVKLSFPDQSETLDIHHVDRSPLARFHLSRACLAGNQRPGVRPERVLGSPE